MNNFKENFDKYGFCIVKKNFFIDEEIKNIENIFEELLKGQNKNVEIDNNCMGGKSLAVKNFIDEKLEIKRFANKIFDDTKLSDTIKTNVGENFKISEITYRRSYPGDIGLGLHQDAIGENTIVINLSNNDFSGKTCFLKSSHNFESINKLFKSSSISDKLTKFSKFFLDFIDTSEGSLIMFNNKVWHGRFPNKSRNFSSSLLIGVYREGSNIKYEDENTFEKIKNKLDYNYEIDQRRNLEHPSITKNQDGSYFISHEKSNNENKTIQIYKNLKTRIYISFLKLIYFFKIR
tara:strand:+ start:2424 stop:3296 length:873 start_codon:yes stop_codon:yes gene_type:complete